MQIHTILFYLFASIALISSIMVIVAKNPIHSVISLILTFTNVTGLLILLKIEFIAMMFIIIYVGAIAVLFLFVVMMLNIKLNELSENLWRYLPIGGLISFIFFVEVFLILYSHFVPFTTSPELMATSLIDLVNNTTDKGAFQDDNLLQILELADINNGLQNSFEANNKQWFSIIEMKNNIENLGQLIYTDYFFYYLVASLILLVAMIGAIVLTMNKKDAAKKQLIFKQVDRTFEEAVAYVENSRK
jgi:NADH-quinone oxidoreductase subunit J